MKHHDMLVIKNVSDSEILEKILNDFESADFLSVNQHNDIWYYNQEQWETLLPWLKTLQFIYGHRGSTSANPYRKEFIESHQTVRSILEYSAKTGYQVEKLKEFGLLTSIDRTGGKRKRSEEVRQNNKKAASKKKTGSKIKDVKSITKQKRPH